METQLHKYFMSSTRAIVFHDMTSVNILLTVSANSFQYCAPVAQLVEHWAAVQEALSSTPAGPSLRVLK